jgi:hypothetical protein
MQFQRLVKATPRAYFGFDHMEIFHLHGEPGPEEDTTTTRSTSPSLTSSTPITSQSSAISSSSLTTTVTTLTPLLTTNNPQTTSYIPQSLFKCDFDAANSCFGAVFQNNTPGLSVQFNATADTGLIAPYIITDISSISKIRTLKI